MKIHLQLITLIVFTSNVLFSQNLVWTKQIKGVACCSSSQGRAITLDTSGNVYTTGIFSTSGSNPIDFDPGPSTYTFLSLPTTTSTSIFVSKLDSYGNFIWAKQFQGSSFLESRSIDVDDSNNVYVTGWFRGTVDFDPGPGIYNLTALSLSDAFVFKLNSNGNLVWAKWIASDMWGYGITVDKIANVYVT